MQLGLGRGEGCVASKSIMGWSSKAAGCKHGCRRVLWSREWKQAAQHTFGRRRGAARAQVGWDTGREVSLSLSSG